ncbi:hypothetical protein Micbo1qcDRAFT_170076 [Microdochium bolleyi]|uniref:HTH psq-type domain-containing protein n=1 Tax=Microdochium bolleyi TaxID=196109 RepID=A0A136IJ35_9PEZI|nr:hypothetical protein Micbo1qcDRAFT_170076 [Microdochium bolleyi]
MDNASQALKQSVPNGIRRSFRTLALHSDVARTTLQYRARGRRSIKKKALVRFSEQKNALGVLSGSNT